MAREGGQGLSIRHLAIPLPLFPHRLMSIDVKYQIWKFGVIFTDNVRRGPLVGEELQEKGLWGAGVPQNPKLGIDS